MNLEELLGSNKRADWEMAHLHFVVNGRVGIDEWIWSWLYHRIQWTSEDYSVFRNETVLIDVAMFGVHLQVETGNFNKRRFVVVKMFEGNPYHPEFQERIDIEEHEWRFSSIGNPFIDQPNYTLWEQLVFAKLLNRAMEERKGLDLLIEAASIYNR